MGYEALGGDEAGRRIGAALELDIHEAGGVLDAGSFVWNWRTAYDALQIGPYASLNKHRAEWRTIIGLPPIAADPLPDLPRIRVEGTAFLDMVHGERWTWKGCTDFMLYKRYLDNEDIAPILSERGRLGANVLRVLGMTYSIERFYPSENPDYFQRLPSFLNLCATYGLYVEFVVFADAQIIMSNAAEQRQHLASAREALAGLPQGVFAELCNENDKNGVNALDHAYPGGDGILWSRGSGLADQAPPRPVWDYSGWHGRRDDPKVWLSQDDMWFVQAGLEERPGQGFVPMDKSAPCVGDEPMGFDEHEQPGKRSTNPELARSLAFSGRAYGQGATFHSSAGILSQPFGPVTMRCAQAFFEAMR